MSDAIATVRLLVLDVDGVLTDGFVRIDDDGRETKAYHIRDGLGLRVWMRLGGEVAIITGRAGMSVRHRANELGIRHVFQAVRDKAATFEELLDDLGLEATEAAMIGDDLPDLPVLRRAGYPIAVADAPEEVRAVASFVTVRPGGHGAVREAIEHLLKGGDRWEDALELFR
jgi:3-deoxy-D-manno-octulosonate 8-phosphate phosphatase (KDO 8-P phosphatase)